MIPPTNNWRYRRTEHRFMRKSLRTSQHGIQNVKTHNRTTQKTKKMKNTDHTKFIVIK
jgi:hypothetical protein